jgi:hypothetical protein
MCDVGKTRDIREAVESELGHDPRVDGGGITVKNVNGGSGAQRNGAELSAVFEGRGRGSGVAGVINVHNHLKGGAVA